MITPEFPQMHGNYYFDNTIKLSQIRQRKKMMIKKLFVDILYICIHYFANEQSKFQGSEICFRTCFTFAGSLDQGLFCRMLFSTSTFILQAMTQVSQKSKSTVTRSCLNCCASLNVFCHVGCFRWRLSKYNLARTDFIG